MGKFIAGDNVVTFTKNANIEKLGLNADNCAVVFTTEKPYRSWMPGRDINQIDKIEKGEKLLIRLKKPLNKLSNFATHE